MAGRTIALHQQIRLDEPCPVPWASMADRGATRWCERCGLHVHDLSQLSRSEAAELLSRPAGRLCVNSVADASGRLLTREELPKASSHARLIERVRRVAVALGLGTAAAALSGCLRTGGHVIPPKDRVGGSLLQSPRDSVPVAAPQPADPQ